MSGARFVGEAEAYRLLETAGLQPPRHALVGDTLPFAPGEPVVLKGLGEDLWHKSELGAVQFCAFDPGAITAAAAAMRVRVEAAGHRWLGGLVCERIPSPPASGLPNEALVSLVRGAGGWTVVCGLGGLAADALADLAPPLRWPIAHTTATAACGEFMAHLLGRIWLGRIRGTARLTDPGQLAGFFGQLWRLADAAQSEGLDLLELNPVVIDGSGRPRPLDAVGRRAPATPVRLGPPAGFLPLLRAPRRIALAGVSAQPGGPGRVILENLERYPLPPGGELLLVKPGHESFLGLRCVGGIGALGNAPVDLLILALPAKAAVEMVHKMILQGGGAAVVAVVSGGIGDGADCDSLAAGLRGALDLARAAGQWTPAVIGPNCLGFWAPAARLDTTFIPAAKLDAPKADGGALTLLSQSGAFLLCRRSRQPSLRFGLGLALGNQLDVAFADVLTALADEGSGGPIAAYIEGFGPGELALAAAAIARLRAQDRQLLLHCAGRTGEGRAAAASHTGALAGDVVLERAVLERAGARMTGTIGEFDAALAWLSAYPRFQPGPAALVTNAGFESVGGGDLLGGALAFARLTPEAASELGALLARHALAGLVAPRVPLDLTPMADETAFLSAADFLLGQCAVLLVGLVPFTNRLRTQADGAADMAQALAHIAKRHGKPVAVAVDAGEAYADYRGAFAAAGLPVFVRMEDALLGLRVLAG